MSKQPSGNKLPLSYSLPPPPPPSSGGKGRGRSKGRGNGRFQPLLRQNNQTGSKQQNNFQYSSQLLGSTYSDKIMKDGQPLLKVENNEISQPLYKLDPKQKLQGSLKKQKKNSLLNSTNDYKKVVNDHKKMLAKTMNYSPQEHFTNLLNSFNKRIYDNVRKSFEEKKDDKKSSVPHQSNNSGDKDQNSNVLSENLNGLSEKGGQLNNNINDQAIPSHSNFLPNMMQTKYPVPLDSGQNSKVTPSRLPNASSSQLKIQVLPDGNQDMNNEAGFAAAAKAALAATSALQYKDQNVDDKHNSVQDCQTNKSEWRCKSCMQSFALEIQLERHKKCKKPDESRLKPVMNFNLDTPEAVANWIEQRKKNYPTDANITRKKELEAERIARGKVLKAQAQALKKRSLDLANAHKAIKKKRLENGGSKITRTDSSRNGITDLLVAASSASTSLDAKIIRMIQPALSMLSANRNLFSNKIFQTVPKPMVSVQKKTNRPTRDFYSKVCIKYRQGHCPRGKDCTNKHTGKMVCPPVQRPPDYVRCRQRNLRELLLYKEIVEEKNMILQCIRHIVNKNFFGVVTNKAIKDAKKRREALVIEVDDQQNCKLSTGRNKKKI